jgi:hypothetical protein
MATGEEALRTEEVAQPGEGARAGVQQTAREEGEFLTEVLQEESDSRGKWKNLSWEGEIKEEGERTSVERMGTEESIL